MILRHRARASFAFLSRAAIGTFMLPTLLARAAEPVNPPMGEPPVVVAEETLDDDFTDYLARRQVILGGGVMVAPEYEGSDKFSIVPVPLLSFSFNESINVDPMGLEFTVFRRDNLSFKLSGQYERGRSEDDSDYLEGMGDIDGGTKIGGELNYQIGDFEIYGKLEKLFGAGDGAQFTTGAVYTYDAFPFLLSLDGSATLADDKYMSTFFGVTPEQSLRSGLPVYDAGTGLKRVDAQFLVTYVASEHWVVRGQAGIGYLVGDAADSPIVKDKVQPGAMLMIAYRF